VGFRLALARPERITAIISQNGNAYLERPKPRLEPDPEYWKEPTPENRTALRDFLKPEATKWQYVHGVQDESQVAPESYELDSALLARPGKRRDPARPLSGLCQQCCALSKFQEYFRIKQPSLLAVWGKNDPFFLPPGAEGVQAR